MTLRNIDPYYRKLGLHFGIVAAYSLVFILIYAFQPHLFPAENETAQHITRIWISRGILVSMFLHFVALFLFDRKWVLGTWRGYWTESDSAKNLALFRIFFMFILTFHTAFHPLEHFLQRAALPASARVSLPYMGWLIHHIPISPDLYHVAIVLGVICGLMATLGIFTRYSLLAYSLLALYIFGVPNFFGKLNHNHILVWFPFLLSLGPAGDQFSIDALYKRLRGIKPPLIPHRKYALPLRMIWMQLGIMYLFAGLWKMWAVGLDWCLTDNLVNLMRWEWVENYDSVPWVRIDKVPWLLKIGGLFVIYFEIFFIILILKPGTRILTFFTGLGFHQSNFYFLNIGFINLQRSYFSLINWEKLMGRIQQIPSKWWKAGALIALTIALERLLHGIYVAPFTLVLILFVLAPKLKRRLKFAVLRKLVRRKQNISVSAEPKPRPAPRLALMLLLGGGLLGINAIHGVFSLNSWPFSAYPAYVDYLPDHMELLRIEAQYPDGSPINLYEAAEKAEFRKEELMRLEPGIIQYYHTGEIKTLDKELRHYVDLWAAYFPELEQAAYIEMYLDAYPLAPEERNNRISHEKIHEWTIPAPGTP